MSAFGPTRGELLFRLSVSLGGLVLLAIALVHRGLPQGPAMFETVVLAGGFFGLTALWAIRKLIRKDHPDGL